MVASVHTEPETAAADPPWERVAQGRGKSSRPLSTCGVRTNSAERRQERA